MTSVVQVSGIKSKRKQPRQHVGPLANLMYLPALFIFGVFVAYPFLFGLQLSFTDWNGFSADRSFIGFKNFGRLVMDPNYRTAITNTFIYGFGSTFFQQVLGLGLAVLLQQKFKGRSLAQALIYLPVLISPVVMGTMYYVILRYNSGALNDLLGLIGVDQTAWLSTSGTSIAFIVIINSLQFVGISMIIYTSGLQSIPQEVEEAAQIDGATPWQSFRRISVPLLLPAFTASVVINLIGGLKLFDVIEVLTAGGPGYSTHSASTLIGKSYFADQSAGYAAAQGIVLFIIIMVFTLLLNQFFDSRRKKLGI